MRKAAVIFILCSFFSESIFIQFVIYLQYKMNEANIAAAYCENKSRPQMHCNGKCYLKKQIERAEQRSQNESRENSSYKFQVFLAPENRSATVISPQRQLMIPHYSPSCSDGFHAATEHPPSVMS